VGLFVMQACSLSWWLCLTFGYVTKKIVDRVVTLCAPPCAVDRKEYERTQTGGIIVLILMTVVMAGTVLARDVLKMWTCFGLTEAGLHAAPTRQLTTMSAAYAPVRFKFYLNQF